MRYLSSYYIWMLLLAMNACNAPPAENTTIKTGPWHGELALTAEHSLPFGFEMVQNADQSYTMFVLNGSERFEMDEVQMNGDSIRIRGIFDSEFVLYMDSDDQWSGNWYNYSRGADYQIPFKARFGARDRFEHNQSPASLATKWAARFSPDSEDEYPAIGVFAQNDAKVTGTFLTETGDYRFLAGNMDGKDLFLSAFDGAHAFLFKARLQEDGSLAGTFFSGNHWEENWIAQADPEARLRTPEELTYLKPDAEPFTFSFPNLEGEQISLSDSRYKDMVVIVQIMGSWCPNCLDETILYQQWYERYKQQGLEIVALAFERTNGDEDLAKKTLARFREKLGIEYEILLAATSNSKSEASEQLSTLNRIISYPTSIFIDREGKVRKIHTGFNGPGTGGLYTRYIEEYSAFIVKLLKEGNPDHMAAN